MFFNPVRWIWIDLNIQDKNQYAVVIFVFSEAVLVIEKDSNFKKTPGISGLSGRHMSPPLRF